MTEPTMSDLNASLLAEPVPEDFVIKTYFHPNHEPCPVTGITDPISLYVPADPTGWLGASCGSCGLTLGT